MSPAVRKFARRSLWLLPIWAVLLFLSTLTHQPDAQTAFADFSAYVTTPQFLVSHLVGSIAGATLGSIGVVGLMVYLQDTRVAGRAIGGMAATVAANIFLTAVFGVAAFAQPAMGRLFLSGQQNALDFYNQTYAGPLFGTALVGVLLFVAGGVLVGSAIAASGLFPRWAGWVYAIAAVGFPLSNFIFPLLQSLFSPLLILATLVLAWSASRQGQGQPAEVGVSPRT
jgi:hypothetical protein